MVIHNSLNNNNTVANFFSSDLANDLGINSRVDNQTNASSGIIIRPIVNAATINNNPEGYQIVINNNVIYIYVINNAGALYALQTLRQLWNQNKTLTAATITDYPRFKYRGVLLDMSRHFFTQAEIENLLDIALVHKLNTLNYAQGIWLAAIYSG